MKNKLTNLIQRWKELGNKNDTFTHIVAIFIAVGLVAISYYYGMEVRQGNTFAETDTRTVDNLPAELVPSPLPTEPVDISVEGQPMLGDPNAIVEVIEFTDFQCPYCKDFAENIIPTMISDYVDTGLVRLIIKDFPLSGHDHAVAAAKAANCAFEAEGSDIYFKYHDLLFANQSTWSTMTDVWDEFIGYAEDLKIDQSQFASCYDSESSQEDIDQDLEHGRLFGVNGTPIFFVNGMPYVGVPPSFEDMKKILEMEIEKNS